MEPDIKKYMVDAEKRIADPTQCMLPAVCCSNRK